jgi:hypothetical protein
LVNELLNRTHGTEREFPIQLRQEDRAVGMPDSVPWSVVETWKKQVERNHGQTLERLAERGGLSPEELYCAASGQSVSVLIGGTLGKSQEELAEWVKELVRDL